MKKEDYMRLIESAGQDLVVGVKHLTIAANPVGLLRGCVVQGWHWWLPGAAVTGFASAKLLRSAFCKKKKRGDVLASPHGFAFWIPTLLKLAPAVLAQIVPLILSLRSHRKP